MIFTDDTKVNDSDGWIALGLTGMGFIPPVINKKWFCD